MEGVKDEVCVAVMGVEVMPVANTAQAMAWITEFMTASLVSNAPSSFALAVRDTILLSRSEYSTLIEEMSYLKVSSSATLAQSGNISHHLSFSNPRSQEQISKQLK